MNKIVYVACPYSSSDPEVVRARIDMFCRVAADLQKEGYTVVSALFNQLLLDRGQTLPSDWTYWKNTSETLIYMSDEVHVIMIDGWKESIGVQGEIGYATWLGLPVKYIVDNSVSV